MVSWRKCAKNYIIAPPRKRRVRERILFSRGENLTREFCTKGGDLHSRLLLLANFLMNFGLIQFERKRVFLTTFSLRSRKNSLRPISRINYHSISENDRILFRPGGGEGGGLLLEGLKWCIEEAWNRYTLSVCVIISVSRVYRIESIGIIRTDIEPCKYNELRRIEKYRGRRVRNDRKIGEGGEGEIDVDSKRWNNHIRIYHQQHFFRDVPHLSLERNRDAFDKYLVTS